VFAFLTIHGNTQSLTIADVAWVGGFLALAVAASGTAPSDDADRMSSSPLWLGLLPYVPVGVALVVTLVDIEPSDRVDPVVLIAGAVMILSILGRQAATMVENHGLVGDLAHLVDELRQNEDHLRHQAFHDGLTGLANRRLFTDRVEHALARARRGGQVAVLLVDLDDFKIINDTLGHFAGDRLLIEVSGRFEAALRDGDTVARLGGDEFAVLLEHADSDPTVDLPSVVADRLLDALDRPVHLDERDVTVRASVGFAVAGPGTTAEQLLGDADLALYAAKDAGKQSARPFQRSLRRAAVDRMELNAALQRAPDELEVHYQPLFDTKTERPTGVEALVRWRHPERGLLAPDVFIPLAEETGVIIEIGRAVLRTACAEIARWQDELGPMPVNVNLSGRQLLHGDVVGDVADALAASGLPASALVLEITESVLTPPGPELLARLHGLKDLGVLLAVDDFGAGYSSLNYLRTLPVDVLKIDKVFIDGAGGDGEGDVLLRAIIELGHSLGLTVVAEGVERPEQLVALRRLGCEQVQGFLLGRPLPARETEAALRLRSVATSPVA
jgi:diguanylate cyclase (GGDEF)-like protein